MKSETLGRSVFAFAVVLVFGALSMVVTWRQSRAFETEKSLDSLRPVSYTHLRAHET